MSNGVTHPGQEVYLLGERGLVASFFLDLSAAPTFERWEAFLGLIGFKMPGRVTEAWSVVQPDFGNKGFGHPDCVARLGFEGGAGPARRPPDGRSRTPGETRPRPGRRRL